MVKSCFVNDNGVKLSTLANVVAQFGDLLYPWSRAPDVEAPEELGVPEPQQFSSAEVFLSMPREEAIQEYFDVSDHYKVRRFGTATMFDRSKIFLVDDDLAKKYPRLIESSL